jgi:integrase
MVKQYRAVRVGLGHFMFVYIHPDRMRVASVRPRVRAFANGCKEAGAVAPPWSFGFHTFRRAFEMTQDRLEAQGIGRTVSSVSAQAGCGRQCPLGAGIREAGLALVVLRRVTSVRE